MSLVSNMVTSLKAVANVPVYTNSRPNLYEDSIMISAMKLAEIETRYAEMYKLREVLCDCLDDRLRLLQQSSTPTR
ncbi:hypothetical protein VE03_10266 [Pseudogymnoascus sp. 23342-1-I1]|nr:hypothetical protein VE03_10266 [Pseudogymnoascus sp. 23342-1-I1]